MGRIDKNRARQVPSNETATTFENNDACMYPDNVVDLQQSDDDVTDPKEAQPISDDFDESTAQIEDHSYGKSVKKTSVLSLSPKSGFNLMKEEMDKMKAENDVLIRENAQLRSKIERPLKSRLEFNDIVGNDEKVKFYTGI